MTGARLLQLVSHVPGRLRVRARLFRDADAANPTSEGSAISEGLRALPGVESVKVTPITGSVLVLYDPTVLGLADILRFIIERGEFVGIEPDLPSSRGHALTAERIIAAAHRANDVTLDLPIPIDMRVAIPGALAGVGLVMMFTRKRRIPEWYDFFWWSFSAFVALKAVRPNREVPDAPFAEDSKVLR